jgi:hypothetical protein
MHICVRIAAPNSALDASVVVAEEHALPDLGPVGGSFGGCNQDRAQNTNALPCIGLRIMDIAAPGHSRPVEITQLITLRVAYPHAAPAMALLSYSWPSLSASPSADSIDFGVRSLSPIE